VNDPPATPSPPIRFGAGGLLRGVRACIGPLVGLIPFGIVTGIVANGAGLSLAECGLMSALVFGGSAQLVALASWGVPVPVLGSAVAAFTVNLRLALMGPVLAPWLDRLRGIRLWGSLFLMADQNWALSVAEMQSGGRDAAFLAGSGLALWLPWIVTTMIGHQVGALIRPAPGHPIFFSALAVFVAMLVVMWRGRGDIVPWAVAAAVSVVTARLVPTGSWYIVAGALAGSLIGGLRAHYAPAAPVEMNHP
jgi:predicted branched-subunit amino acid permease